MAVQKKQHKPQCTISSDGHCNILSIEKKKKKKEQEDLKWKCLVLPNEIFNRCVSEGSKKD